MNAAPTPLRLMLVDDHTLVRLGFRVLLETTPGFEVVAEAGNGEQALELLAQTAVDVIILDLSMPGLGGLETLHRIRAHDPAARVLVLSAHEEVAFMRRTLRAGARGYLSKRTAPEELVSALNAVACGRIYLEARMSQPLAMDGLGVAHKDPVASLSEREFTVFLRLAQGATVKEIADELALAQSTVGTHLYNIKRKLDVSTQAELTLLAIRNQLIEA